ncbi:MAG: Ig-like domain repeat protein [Anaeromyxobacter sp.]
MHHAIWTSNQDVRPPADGDWTRYTPVGAAGPSVWDPTVTRPACVPGNEGSRNQNIYTARITSGLAVSTPQNVKPLSATVTRAFVAAVTNSTDRVVAVRLTATPPAGVAASFRNDGVTALALEVLLPPRSSAARSLFVRLAGATDPLSTIPVRVEETDASGGCLGATPPACPVRTGGLGGSVTFNPPGVFAGLRQPDGSPDDVASGEVYAPALLLANVTSANVTSANVTSANVTSANVTSANVTSANVTSTHVSNPDLANVTSANVTSANVTSANVTSANVTSAPIASANVTSANVTSASITDANYTLTNTGNTSHSYHLKIVGTPTGGPLQLVVSKPSYTPLAIGCVLLQQPRNVVVLNVPDVSAAILPPGSALLDPNIPDPSTTNATVELAPGETAQITLRGAVGLAQMAGAVGQLTPVAIPHAGGTFAAALIITSGGADLPAPRVGVPYSGTLAALGGQGPYSWTLAGGSLPAGLTLGAGGVVTGTPTAAGTVTFTVQVTDAAQATAQRSVTLSVQRGPTTTALAVSPTSSVSGQPVTLTATVAPADPLAPAASGSVTFTDGGVSVGSAPLSGGVATLVLPGLSVGGHTIQASYPGDGRYLGSSSAQVLASVGLASSALALTAAPNPSSEGTAVTFTATVTAVAPGSGTPTGAVTFSDGGTSLATVALAGGQATFTTSALAQGAHAIGAAYGGDARFSPASAALTQTVQPPPRYGFAGFLSPLSAAGTLTAPSWSGPQKLGSGVPLKWILTSPGGTVLSSLSTTRRITAILNPACSGPPPAGSAVVLLYSPTAGATGNSTFRFSSGQFIFNWDTSSASRACYTIALELDDGSPPRATTVKLQ